ncbi:MAG: hypothetical protein HYX41_02750 [Bdellovibrio sp.]|nr:hypothetical protein [Bdellovibrio sp.]
MATVVAGETYHLYHRRHTNAPTVQTPISPYPLVLESDRLTPLLGSNHPLQPDFCDTIYLAFCQKQGITRDPTGSVRPDLEGERRALELYEALRAANPEKTAAEIDEDLVKKIYTQNERQQIQHIFQWVVQTMEDLFEKSPEFTAQEKHWLKSRLRKVHLQIPPPASIYADEPDLLTKNEVYYERTLNGETRLRVGGAFLFTARSKFNWIFTMAHELAHDVDPCEIRFAHQSFPPYDRLTACFLENGVIARRNTRAECGANDQLSEVFADWVAVQITAVALEHFATEFDPNQVRAAAQNSVRDLCEQNTEEVHSDLELHPSGIIRIGVFGKNPRIRSILGCRPLDKPTDYCTFDWKKEQRT